MKIGLFDSGLGGLSVVKALQKTLPQASLVYIGDTANVPFGDKSPETIRMLSTCLLDFLVTQNVDLIAIACNTSSALLLPEYQTYKGIPVLGLLQAACQSPLPYSSLGILATSATVNSQSYLKEIFKAHPQLHCTQLACPEFVPWVENGQSKTLGILPQLKQRLKPLLKHPPEAIMLGCSHYPFLEHFLQALFPKGTVFVDPAQALAQKVEQNIRALASTPSPAQFFVTGHAQDFSQSASALLGKPIEARHIDLHKSSPIEVYC